MSVAQVIPNLEKTKEIVESLLSSKLASCQTIKGGRNSRVYKLECTNGENFIGKFYYRDQNDLRDRLKVEYSSLHYLWHKGIRCIPQPLYKDVQNHCAIYQYIEGSNFSSQEITRADIDQVLEFIDSLQVIKQDVPEGQFSNASEACFSIEEILANINVRRGRLNHVGHAQLKDFLKVDFDAFWEELVFWARKTAAKNNISVDEVLPLDKRVLSPSDFGFHNAIQMTNGKIVFCDFEYFGWDDPAKMIADFLLHPAMHVGDDLKSVFVQGVMRIYSHQTDLSERLRMVYPLYGMKWCLIFLNEFLTQDFSRRIFANHKIDEETLKKEQLEKAKKMLTRIKTTYKDGPYANS